MGMFAGKTRLALTPEERAWVLYDVGNSAFALTVMTSVMPLFYKSYFAGSLSESDSTALWGVANSAACLGTAVLAPLLGTLADFKGFKKAMFCGFAFGGAFLTAVLAAPSEGSWLVPLLIYAAALMGFSCANIFYDSMLVDISGNERMDWVSASGYAWGYIGSVVPFAASLGLIFWGGSHGLQVETTKAALVITGLWWLALTIPLLLKFRQRYFVERKAGVAADSFRRLFSTFSQLRRHRSAFLFMLAYFFFIDGVDTVIKMAVPYGRDIGLGAGMLLLVILVVQLVAFPSALVYGRLCGSFGAKRMICAGIGAYCLITTSGFMIPFVPSASAKTALFWAMAVMVGLFQGGIQAASRSLFGRLIPKSQSAEFFGFFNICGKFGTIAGPLMMAAATKLTNDSRYGILAIVPLFIAGFAILLAVREEDAAPSEG